VPLLSGVSSLRLGSGAAALLHFLSRHAGVDAPGFEVAGSDRTQAEHGTFSEVDAGGDDGPGADPRVSPEFHRVRERNRKLLKDAEKNGAVKILLNSNVKGITEDHVCLESAGSPVTVENDFVLALIGGESPEDFLRKVGVEIVEKTI